MKSTPRTRLEEKFKLAAETTRGEKSAHPLPPSKIVGTRVKYTTL